MLAPFPEEETEAPADEELLEVSGAGQQPEFRVGVYDHYMHCSLHKASVIYTTNSRGMLDRCLQTSLAGSEPQRWADSSTQAQGG